MLARKRAKKCASFAANAAYAIKTTVIPADSSKVSNFSGISAKLCREIMKPNRLMLVLIAIAAFLAAVPSMAQTETFSDPTVDYSFQLPDGKWKMTVKPSATSPNVEYVYGDRVDGHLEIRKLTVTKDAILTDIVQAEEQKLQFRYGFVAGKEENFAGHLRGAVYNFEYVASGRSMAGRFYFLRVNETTVYILRFSGQKDSIRSIRSQTDSIARTFGVK